MIDMQANSFDRISPTALLVAYARQFTDIPYSQELAQLVNAQMIVEQILGEQSEPPVEVVVLLEGRYKAINQVMIQYKATQILEIASGLLPRGMALSQNPDVTFVESDLPMMIGGKQQLVKQLIGERPNLHFLAIDATSRPSQFPLNVDYLHPKQPIMILCEGLLMYLTLTQKQQVFANVREILQAYGGVWITSDSTTLESLSRQQQISATFQNLNQVISNATSRSVSDTYFEDLKQFKQFVIVGRRQYHPGYYTSKRVCN